MNRNMKIVHKVESAMWTNMFLYYLSKIPLIGKIVTSDVYGDYDLKRVVRIIALLCRIMKQFIGKILTIIFAYIPVISIWYAGDKESAYQVFLYLFFMLSVIGAAIFNITLVEVKQQRYIAIQLMKVPAKDYLLSAVCRTNLWKAISYLPAVLVTVLIYGGNALQAILLCCYAGIFHFVGEGLAAWYFHKTRKNFKNMFMVISALIFMVAAYVPMALGKVFNVERIIFSFPVLIIISVLSILFYRYLLKFTEYERMYYATNRQETLYVDKKQLSREAQFRAVKIKDKDYQQLDSIASATKYGNKKGYRYLNAIFFARHKRLFLQKDFYICIFVAALTVAAAIVFQWNPKLVYIDVIKRLSAPLVFVMYLIASMTDPTKALFYNCDLSLLRYPFYREQKAVLSNFIIRLKYIIFVNVIPAVAIDLGLLILCITTGSISCIGEAMPVLLLILALAVFFSVFYLSIYYLLQPYTTELGIKNPLYKILYWGLYCLCYLCLQIDQPATIFLYGVLIGIVVYSVISMVLVFKLAPKTFRIR